jgi:Fe-S cluster biosynthesis and repair protein YggX
MQEAYDSRLESSNSHERQYLDDHMLHHEIFDKLAANFFADFQQKRNMLLKEKTIRPQIQLQHQLIINRFEYRPT